MILYLQSADNKDELYPAVEWDNEGEYLTAISSGDRFVKILSLKTKTTLVCGVQYLMAGTKCIL